MTQPNARSGATRRNTRVAGHTLPNEGRVYWPEGGRADVGPATCSCGWRGVERASDAARKRDHAAHKVEVRTGRPWSEVVRDA